MIKIIQIFSRFLTRDVVLFIIMITIMLISLKYLWSTFIPPQGLHEWRQCVGASIAMNYYNDNLDVTKPRIYNHIGKGGDSDITLVEFPILYYAVAILYKIFGPYDSIFRIVNAIVLFIGFFYLFKTVKILLDDKFLAILFPAILFSSPTLAFYGNSFLPDTTALGIVCIALYFIVKYSREIKMKYLYIASAFFSLAGLLKISSLLSFIAILLTFVIFASINKDIRLKYKLQSLIIPSLVPFAAAIVWYYFVDYYNKHFGATISPVEIRPIWRLDQETILKTWHRIKIEWITSYFHNFIHITVLLCLFSTLIFFKKTNKFITSFSILALLGAISFFLLFYRSMYHHDYYMINNFIVWIIILLNGFLLLKKSAPVVFKSWILKIALITLIVVSTIRAEKIVNFKYKGYYNTWFKVKFHGLVDIEKVNRKFGIKPDDLIISMPDESNNISLYLMNQPGFTDYGFGDKSGKERIDFLISKGAKYLVISDTSIYRKNEYQYLNDFTNYQLFKHKNIDVFNLQPYKK